MTKDYNEDMKKIMIKLMPTFFKCTKGQIKSEWIYEIINFPEIDPKNFLP